MIERLGYYLKLLRAHLVARRFYRSYEGLTRDVAFHPDLDVRLDVYTPDTGDAHPVLIFVHGGNWDAFHKEIFAPVAMKLLPKDLVVVIPDYTLYPRADCEQMTREVAAAISWTLENVERYDGDPGRVVVGGQSAGGHLVGLALMDPRFLEAHDHAASEVYGLVGISGAYDLVAQCDYERAKGGANGTKLLRTMLGMTGGEEKLAAASPVHYVPNLEPGFPPLALIHGDADQTVPVDVARGFHAALQQVGAQSRLIVYPGRGHSELLFSALTEKRPQLVADVVDFVHGCSLAQPTR